VLIPSGTKIAGNAILFPSIAIKILKRREPSPPTTLFYHSTLFFSDNRFFLSQRTENRSRTKLSIYSIGLINERKKRVGLRRQTMLVICPYSFFSFINPIP